MAHPNYVVGFSGSLEELAQNVGAMRYDCVAEFLQLLAKNMNEQAAADQERNRPKLASKLELTAVALHHSYDAMNEAWRICAPYMDSKDE